MKTQIAFLYLLFFTISVSAQCDWEKNGIDPFTGTISRSTIWETITRAFFSRISFQIVEYPQDSSMFLNVKVNMKQRSSSQRFFDAESKIMIKSGDTFITIKFLESVARGDILVDYGKLSSGDIDFLKHNLIDMVRIYFDKGYNDYKIKDPKSIIRLSKYQKSKDYKSDYFIRTLKCFE